MAVVDVDELVERGFVRLPGAFSRSVADACRAICWGELGLRPDDPSGWTQPVIRLGSHRQPPFVEAESSPRLAAACDLLVGEGRWVRHGGVGGTMPVRFPVPGDPGDDGWHIDGSFDGPPRDDGLPPYRANVRSDGRALLLLFLFSDVGPDDAPTRIRVGSHLDVPPVLAPHGEEGAWFGDVGAALPPSTHDRELALATGEPGDVYLCHPFLLHAAQRHGGGPGGPRFMAQPPLLPAGRYDLDAGTSPVELAIRRSR